MRIKEKMVEDERAARDTLLTSLVAWVREKNIPIRLYWTKSAPEAGDTGEAVEVIRKNSFIPRQPADLDEGWLSFIGDGYRNGCGEPLVISFNVADLSSVEVFNGNGEESGTLSVMGGRKSKGIFSMLFGRNRPAHLMLDRRLAVIHLGFGRMDRYRCGA